LQLDEERGILLIEGKVWIPTTATDLQLRLCVVAHAGASGHRGVKTTLRALTNVFFWTTVAEDVATFVSECLHCMTIAGGRVSRTFGETLRATKPNELMHFDFLTMVKGEGGMKYVLVLKDGMCGFVELMPCIHATADQVYQG